MVVVVVEVEGFAFEGMARAGGRFEVEGLDFGLVEGEVFFVDVEGDVIVGAGKGWAFHEGDPEIVDQEEFFLGEGKVLCVGRIDFSGVEKRAEEVGGLFEVLADERDVT